MNSISFIEEPDLQFGTDNFICPKFGVEKYLPYDINAVRPERVKTGIIGKASTIPDFISWLRTCEDFIPGKKSKVRQNLNLFPSFPGFNTKVAFKSELVYDESFIRNIVNSKFDELNDKSNIQKKELICDLYFQEIKYLAQNKRPDVIICLLPEDDIPLQDEDEIEVEEEEENANEVSEAEDEDEVEEVEEVEEGRYNNDWEFDLRRMLKAKSMEYKIPIQIIRDRIVKPSSSMQDKATIAWNLFTALYYKAFGTPWAMIRNEKLPPSCYAGISFYRSRDKKTIQTSIAQIFNEYGKGVILRGSEVEIKKEDRQPHLTDNQAFEILNQALKEYKASLDVFPARLVLHKTSNFTEEEINGFNKVLIENKISKADYVSILKSNIKLYRNALYPPRRGTLLSLTDKHHIFYTRGTVEYFKTYTGKYIPQPLDIRIFRCDSSVKLIIGEILSLTKMNWNNTQFDRKFPITIESAKKVGDIMKYIPMDMTPEIRYSFYM